MYTSVDISNAQGSNQGLNIYNRNSLTLFRIIQKINYHGGGKKIDISRLNKQNKHRIKLY